MSYMELPHTSTVCSSSGIRSSPQANNQHLPLHNSTTRLFDNLPHSLLAPYLLLRFELLWASFLLLVHPHLPVINALPWPFYVQFRDNLAHAVRRLMVGEVNATSRFLLILLRLLLITSI
eukprot:Gb_29386 [translate_table: standard]